MAKSVTPEQSRLLFYVLAANGAFSGLSGLVMLVQSKQVAAWIGLSQPLWLTGIGLALVFFGANLLWLARKGSLRVFEAVLISAMDFAWIVITTALALGIPGLFNPTGVYVVLLVAFIVLVFLDLQLYALWKIRS